MTELPPPIWQMSQELADSLPGEDEINEHVERLIAEQSDKFIKFDIPWLSTGQVKDTE